MEGAGKTEVAYLDSRGSRVGMLLKICCPVLEIHFWGRGGRHPACIRQRKHVGQDWKSEGFIRLQGCRR